MHPSRRSLGFIVAAPVLLHFAPSAWASGIRMVVFRDENCGCCGDWVEHIRAAGFEVEVRVHPSMNRKKTELGIPPEVRSCHTAEIGGYLVEGHVPADEIRRLLATRPDARGLAVPRMPVGSPGMEVGTTRHAYKVIGLRQDGKEVVVATYSAIK